MNAKLFNVSLLAAGVLLASASPANAIGYTFTDLGYLGKYGWQDYSEANGINNSGQVVGVMAGNATIWDSTALHTPTDLGGGTATAINNSGQVVGYVSAGWPNLHAVIWNGTTPTYLDTLGANYRDAAYAINDSGAVVGYSFAYYKGDLDQFATIWDGTALHTPTKLGGGGWASGINDSGQVVGHTNFYTAMIWNYDPFSATTQLGSLGGCCGVATAINNSGQVVGYSETLHGTSLHATIWDGTAYHTPTDLGTGVYAHSYATAINNSGQVVGYSSNSSTFSDTHATIWDGTASHTPTDLNDFLSLSDVDAGWVLDKANGINDNGWIVGNAHNNRTNIGHAFLLTPVPEPETYALFMAGLGLMGFIARRRKNGQA